MNTCSSIEPVIAAVIAATVVYATSLAWANREVAINVAMTVWKAVCDWAETAAIIAMTLAQDGLNAALALCPITWIIYAIIALIAIVYLAVAAYNEFTGSALSATGLIVGSFYWLGAVILNVFRAIANFGIAVVEALVNVFNLGVFKIEMFFYKLAVGFLDNCYSMAKGWDAFANAMSQAFVNAINSVILAWNDLMKILPDSIKMALSIGEGDMVSAGTFNAAGMVGSARDALKAPTAPESVHYDRVAYENTSAAFDKGYKQGAALGEKASSAIKKATEIATPEAGELGAGTGGVKVLLKKQLKILQINYKVMKNT